MAEEPKRIVLEFCRLCFVQKQPRIAFERYVAATLIQHNPGVPDGAEAAVASLEERLRQNPDLKFDIRRAIAEGDIVALHVLVRSDPEDRGRAVVDIFRVSDQRIVEHWDVVQPMPASAENPHPMF
jgi:predicted SnoaL-like aldol condensation-catalyzing enzyme